MAKILLITNPDDDEPSKYLGAWCEKIIKFASKRKDVKILHLHYDDVKRKKFEDVIKTEEPQLVLFNGHGNHDRIYGFGQEVLIKANDNEYLLKNKIIHALACSAGKTLAPECIKIGALAYIGYSENFKFDHLGKQTNQERLRDDVANFFFEPAFEAAMSLIEGDTVEEAYKKSRTLHLENFKMLLASPKTEYNTTVASHLFHNIQCQVCLGDGGAKF